MFQHILFATDGSFGAERATDHTVALAVQFHTKMTVLHAFKTITTYTFPNVDAYAIHQDAVGLVEHTAKWLRDQGIAEVATEVVPGQPAHAILSLAETRKSDAIVMGARGISTWQGLLLGSTNLPVVQRA